jgi:hypothetical protein
MSDKKCRKHFTTAGFCVIVDNSSRKVCCVERIRDI